MLSRQVTIEEQLEAIERATKEALKSKESALKFLRDAGIIPPEDKPVRKSKKKRQR